MSQGQLPKALKTASQLCMLHILPNSANQSSPREGLGDSPALTKLLSAYSELFQEPTTLSPSRGPFDHKIALKDGTSPINLRPYKYSLRHKDIIEKLVEELLDRG